MSKQLDLLLYLVTDTALCCERGVAATVAAAVEGGATAVQLRDPAASGRQLHELACRLVGELAATPVAFFVDDRLDVALAAGADGVHLGQRDLPATAARRVAGRRLWIGWSVSTPEQAANAGRLPPGTVDYLGAGPVFATATKPDAAAPTGLDGLAAICAASPVPCVGIGGIDESRAASVRASGAVGVAVVSAICGAADPLEATRRLRRALSGGRAEAAGRPGSAGRPSP